MADARQETHAYLIGGGIASLAAAAFLIRDGRVSGMNIHILEETDRLGGSLDAQGSPEKGYILRGGRMFDEEAYTCTYDLLSSIPSIRNPSLSVKADMDAFNEQVTSHSHARLIDSDGNKVDVTYPGFSHRDRADLVKLLALPEEVIGARRITELLRAVVLQDQLLVPVGHDLRVSAVAQRDRSQALPPPVHP